MTRYSPKLQRELGNLDHATILHKVSAMGGAWSSFPLGLPADEKGRLGVRLLLQLRSFFGL